MGNTSVPYHFETFGQASLESQVARVQWSCHRAPRTRSEAADGWRGRGVGDQGLPRLHSHGGQVPSRPQAKSSWIPRGAGGGC
jgi:hypothetical protein